MENVFPLHQGLDLLVKFFLIIYPQILKPKNKKTKQTPAQHKVQHSLDDWLNKDVKEATVRFNEKSDTSDPSKKRKYFRRKEDLGFKLGRGSCKTLLSR